MRKPLKVRQLEFTEAMFQSIDAELASYTKGSHAQLDKMAGMLASRMVSLGYLNTSDCTKKDRQALIDGMRMLAVKVNVVVGKAMKEF